ncbi:hypothetical protein [Agromyces marinus]|uniref:DNA polymerase III subunit gamma/tau n=1 Tax=Agromyces marinus TaxID=1389020 RepID=A0ABM8H5G8_9MICO|nr:hypothetical protein [Agromyces marinus]UIP58973.1 hypothetical protein DSM26151_18640 [Agromyces marinus]BDZ56057.1 hypothetical protein GCM10025870_31300 [Agromyces marinus]
MARDGDDEEALQWEGDDEAALAEGWKRGGASPAAPVGGTVDGTDAAASAAPGPEARDEAPTQVGSTELVLLGIFAGAYLLYTLGWILTVFRVTNPGADALAQFMFALGLWLAVLAPALWFGVTFALTQGRTVRRFVWLAVGAVVLLPVAFVAGVGS